MTDYQAIRLWYRGEASEATTARLLDAGYLKVQRYGGHIVASAKGVRLSGSESDT